VILLSNINNFAVKEKNDKSTVLNSCDFNNTDYQRKDFEEIKMDWRQYCELWKSYPDYFIDFIKAPECKIDLYFYQRIFLRIFFRYQKVFITATRGTAKSFTEILAMYLKCIFFPGIQQFICAPGKEQSAKISQENIEKIWEYYPILMGEIKYKSFAKDYTKLIFHNGSKLDVVQVRDSARGGRRHGGAVEEIADEKFDGDLLASVVLPLMANNRISMCKGIDPDEKHKQQFYVTTAGTRQSFAYKKMKEILGDMVKGKSAFAIGNGYELPCLHKQLDIDFIMELKESPTYNPLAFQREYESVWTGSDTNSLVQLDDLNKCRILTKAELKIEDKDWEYVLAYDVARSEGNANAESSLSIIKIKDKGNGEYFKLLVNIYGFEGTHFLEQALFLKRMVNQYKARILVIDSNGLGKGCVDFLTTDIDENLIYEVVNDDRFDRYKTADSIPMIYNIVAHSKEHKNSDIHNVFINNISNHKIKLLKTASSVKTEISEKRNMTMEKEVEELAPFYKTDKLCDEIMNLQYKQAGTETQVKQISRSIPKDMFSSLEYGLYWIYKQEQENKTKDEEQDFSQFMIIPQGSWTD